VDGGILVAPPRELLLEKVDVDHVPVVLCACQAPNSRKGWKNCDSVTMDNTRAMNALLEHLLDKGCRRVVHLRGMSSTYDARERSDAFDAFVARTPDIEGSVIDGATWRDTARDLVLNYIDQEKNPPDAFVCFNDVIAFGVMEAVRQRGYSIPEDVKVTGFDDTIMADFISLTSVHVPGVLIGEETAKLLFMRLNESEETRIARNTMIELTLKYRASSC